MIYTTILCLIISKFNKKTILTDILELQKDIQKTDLLEEYDIIQYLKSSDSEKTTELLDEIERLTENNKILLDRKKLFAILNKNNNSKSDNEWLIKRLKQIFNNNQDSRKTLTAKPVKNY